MTNIHSSPVKYTASVLHGGLLMILSCPTFQRTTALCDAQQKHEQGSPHLGWVHAAKQTTVPEDRDPSGSAIHPIPTLSGLGSAEHLISISGFHIHLSWRRWSV